MLQSVHVEQRMAAFPLNKINFCLLHRALPDVQSETWRMLWAANRRGISRADLTNLTLIFSPVPLPFLPSLPAHELFGANQSYCQSLLFPPAKWPRHGGITYPEVS